MTWVYNNVGPVNTEADACNRIVDEDDGGGSTPCDKCGPTDDAAVAEAEREVRHAMPIAQYHNQYETCVNQRLFGCRDDDAAFVTYATTVGLSVTGCADAAHLCDDPGWSPTLENYCCQTCNPETTHTTTERHECINEIGYQLHHANPTIFEMAAEDALALAKAQGKCLDAQAIGPEPDDAYCYTIRFVAPERDVR